MPSVLRMPSAFHILIASASLSPSCWWSVLRRRRHWGRNQIRRRTRDSLTHLELSVYLYIEERRKIELTGSFEEAGCKSGWLRFKFVSYFIEHKRETQDFIQSFDQNFLSRTETFVFAAYGNQTTNTLRCYSEKSVEIPRKQGCVVSST
jgi:hypothetical protein